MRNFEEAKELHFESNCIQKKAFLGNRNLENVKVSSYINSVEDWAFAHCKKLETIFLPDTVLYIGNRVFDGCSNLKRVVIYTEGKNEVILYEQSASLLAFALTHFEELLAHTSEKLDENSIYNFRQIATSHWYEKYDKILLEYINEPDDKGFMPFLAGGEEDYEDPANNLELYCEMKQKEKIAGIFIRCDAFDDAQKDIAQKESAFYKALQAYLLSHMDVVISYILEQKELAIYDLKKCDFFDIFTKETIEMFVSRIQGDAFVESTAFLLSKKDQLLGKNDAAIWSQFDL